MVEGIKRFSGNPIGFTIIQSVSQWIKKRNVEDTERFPVHMHTPLNKKLRISILWLSKSPPPHKKKSAFLTQILKLFHEQDSCHLNVYRPRYKRFGACGNKSETVYSIEAEDKDVAVARMLLRSEAGGTICPEPREPGPVSDNYSALRCWTRTLPGKPS